MSHAKLKIEYFVLILVGAIAFYGISGGNIILFDNISWLFGGDSSQHYMGWAFFRDAPWQFPVGVNSKWGLDLSGSIVFTDSLPLFAIPFKLLSPWLPETFQYFGLWILICFVLQAFFSWKILRHFIDDRFICVLATGFFVTAPPMLWRLHGHTSLLSHYVILAGLYLYISGATHRRTGYWLALLASTALIHAYLLAMVSALWVASLADGLIGRRLAWKRAAAEMVAGVVLVGFMAWQAGYFSVIDGGGGGFGIYRMNLFSLVDADGWSHFLPNISGGEGDYEGFNYLGLGGMALAVLVLPRLAGSVRLLPALLSAHPALALVGVGLFFFALSNNIGLGSINVTVDISNTLKRLANIFQSSGRFFWPIYYGILLTIVIVVARRWVGWRSRALLALALIVQVWDMTPGWTFRSGHLASAPAASWKLPLASPFWEQAAGRYTKLRAIMPDNHPRLRHSAPDRGMGDWLSGAGFALQNRLETDIIYFARIDRRKLQASRDRATAMIGIGNYAADTLYLLDENIVGAVLVTAKTETDLLTKIDGFYLLAPGWRHCSTCLQTEPVRREAFFQPAPLDRDILVNTSNKTPYLASGWYQPDTWGVWSSGKNAVLAFRDPLPSRLRLRLKGHAYGPNRDQDFQLQFGNRQYPFRLSGATTEVVLEMTTDTPVSTLSIIVPTPMSPEQLGENADRRTLGIGLVSLRLEPLAP